MYKEEREKMLDVLAAADTLSSESKRPASLRKIVNLMDDTPNPTVYSWVGRAVEQGLLTRAKDEDGYQAVAITLKGYRLLGKSSPESVSEARRDVFGYKEAYLLLSEIFLNAEALDASQRDVLKEAVDALIRE